MDTEIEVGKDTVEYRGWRSELDGEKYEIWWANGYDKYSMLTKFYEFKRIRKRRRESTLDGTIKLNWVCRWYVKSYDDRYWKLLLCTRNIKKRPWKERDTARTMKIQ